MKIRKILILLIALTGAISGYSSGKTTPSKTNKNGFTKQQQQAVDEIMKILIENERGDAKTPSDSIVCSTEEIFVTVEQPAEFPGGIPALMEWLGDNIVYPESAERDDTEGKVVVKFVVESDGSIGAAEILRSVREDLDNEALRVVKIMPKWIPGRIEGTAVRSYFTLPVNFKLQRDEQTLNSESQEKNPYDVEKCNDYINKGDLALRNNDPRDALNNYCMAFEANPWELQLIGKCLDIIGNNNEVKRTFLEYIGSILLSEYNSKSALSDKTKGSKYLLPYQAVQIQLCALDPQKFDYWAELMDISSYIGDSETVLLAAEYVYSLMPSDISRSTVLHFVGEHAQALVDAEKYADIVELVEPFKEEIMQANISEGMVPMGMLYIACKKMRMIKRASAVAEWLKTNYPDYFSRLPSLN